MGRLRFGLVALALSAPLAACAAVTGLGDYDIVECVTGCDAGAETGTSRADASVLPAKTDASNAIDATAIDTGVEPVADAAIEASTDAGVDGGVVVIDSGADAGLPTYAPSCARTSCANVTSPCRDQSCDNGDKWPKTTQTTGVARAENGECLTKSGGSGAGFGYIYNSHVASSRYDFEVRFKLNSREDPPSNGPILRLSSGTTTITVERTGDDLVRLCVGSDCSAATTVPGLGNDVTNKSILDVYGRWGDAVSNGYVRFVSGPIDGCTERLERVLPGPSNGALLLQLGCFTASCDMLFDDVVFIQRPF